MTKSRVGVLRGGTGHEYDVSLKTGAAALEHMPAVYEPIDILITKDGQWHIGGLPAQPADLMQLIDLAFIALHGEYGEDGTVQKILEELGIPYVGSTRTASRLALDKAATKQILTEAGVNVPYHLIFEKGDGEPADLARHVFTKLSPSWVVKPVDRGSSVGLTHIRAISDLASAIEEAFKYSDTILVEEFIRGKEASCGIIDNYRSQRFYPVFPTEIVRPQGDLVWTYEGKYGHPETKIVSPGRFTTEESEELQALATLIHETLGLRHYSRSDFIVSPRGIYALEVNTLPTLIAGSVFPESLAAIGCTTRQFLEHVIGEALSV